MKKLFIFLLFTAFISGCYSSNYQIKTDDFPVVKEKVAFLIKEELARETDIPQVKEIVPGSIKVHQVYNIEGLTYVLASLKYKLTGTCNTDVIGHKELETMKLATFQEVLLRVVEKEDSPFGYRLLGDFGGSKELDTAPITVDGGGNWIYGLVNDSKAAKVVVNKRSRSQEFIADNLR